MNITVHVCNFVHEPLGVGYPHPPVMHAELLESGKWKCDAANADSDVESSPTVVISRVKPNDDWQDYVRGVVYGGLVRRPRHLKS